MPSPVLVLVKHALPILEASTPPHTWRLGAAGGAQAEALAGRLRAFLPCRLVSSPEPKAVRTSEIVSAALGVPFDQVDGLQELDRPALPIMSIEDHQRLNAEVFAHPDRAVLGSESARTALTRFRTALAAELHSNPAGNLVVVTHGTVMSLFVAAYNVTDAFTFWKSLECASFVVLELPSFRLQQAGS